MSAEWIAQGLGGIAIVSSIIIYSRKTRKKLLIFKSVQDICWFLHYILLAAFSAAATSALCVFRSFVYYNNDKKFAKSKLWLPIFLTLYAISAIFTWKGIFSIFPAMSSSVSAVAFWMKNPRHTKMLAILASTCTLIYNVTIAHSISVYIGVTFTITTSLLSLILPILKSKKEEKTQADNGS